MARFQGGWVKIHRKAILGDIGSNYMRSGLFQTLVCIANLGRSTVSWKGRPATLGRGEIVTSYRELAELGEVDRKSVMRHLRYLALRGTILIEKSFGGLRIKIQNFDKYQSLDAEGSQVTPISADGDRDGDLPNDGTHIEELKKERIKEGKGASASADRLPLLAQIWNEHRGTLAKVIGSNKSRTHRCKLRFAECSKEDWITTVSKIAASDFCNGKNDRGWKASFDWILQPETRLKVLEGKYDNGLGNGLNDDLAQLRAKYAHQGTIA